MAGQLSVGKLQLNDNVTSTYNFWINEDNAGGLQLYRGNVGTTTTPILTVDTNGNVAIPGNTTIHTAAVTPMFSAYQSTLQSLTNIAYTQIQFQTKEFDTTSAFNNTNATVGITPAYAFLPLVAGYYQVSAGVNASFSSAGTCFILLYKNGVESKRGMQVSTIATTLCMSALIYCNGTTDYLTACVYQSTGGAINSITGSSLTYFQAALIARA
jgi:hypothetical protein